MIPDEPPPPARIWWAALLAMCLLLLAPLAVTEVPPLLDYPNHLARLEVLALDGADPLLARFYAPRWAVIPDLGIDVLGLGLLRLMPLYLAGRVIIGICLLLPVLGCIAYARAAFGRRGWWMLAVGLVGWNQILLAGFLNFSLGLGVALLLAAGWLAWGERRPFLALFFLVPGTVVLFFCHLLALLFFVLLAGSQELARLWRRRSLRGLAPRLATALLALAPPLLLYTLSPLNDEAGGVEFASVAGKFALLLAPFVNVVAWLDIATAALVIAVPVLAIAARRCRVAGASGIALALALAFFLLAPSEAKGASNIDVRFLALAGFLMFAALRPVHLPRFVPALLAGLFVLRIVVLGVVWQGRNEDLAELRAVMAAVPPGSAVAVTSVEPDEAPEFWAHLPMSRRLSNGLRVDVHLPALLSIERRAFYPFLFDNLSQQPVMKRPPYAALADQIGGVVGHAALRPPRTMDLCGYDQLLLLEAAGDPAHATLAPDLLTIVADSDFVALYTVNREVACAGAPAVLTNQGPTQ